MLGFLADTHFSTFTGSQNLDTDRACKRAKILQDLHKKNANYSMWFRLHTINSFAH